MSDRSRDDEHSQVSFDLTTSTYKGLRLEYQYTWKRRQELSVMSWPTVRNDMTSMQTVRRDEPRTLYTTYPSSPLPPHPLLGVKASSTVSPEPRMTLTEICRCGDREGRNIIIHSTRLTFSLVETSSARGCNDDADGNDARVNDPNERTRSSRRSPYSVKSHQRARCAITE